MFFKKGQRTSCIVIPFVVYYHLGKIMNKCNMEIEG